MKGITPVIAIILLLLMAVAAAGGFYFVYQNFSETGQESGSSQIGALGEQTTSAIKIESISEGTVYVKNTGVNDIDMTTSQIFIENAPVEATVSREQVGQNELVQVALPQGTTCSGESCEVKVVTSKATATQRATQAQLMSSCGDGTCSRNELINSNCFTDCGPHPFAMGHYYGNISASFDMVAAAVEWNGTGLNYGANLSSTIFLDPSNTHLKTYFFGDEDLAIGSRVYDSANGKTIPIYSHYNGTHWSDLTDLSTQDTDGDMTADYAKYPSGRGMTVWNVHNDTWTEYAHHILQYAIWDGSSFSTAQNVTWGGEPIQAESHSIATIGEDNVLLVFRNWTTSTDYNTSYSIWDGASWSKPTQITGGENHFPEKVCALTDSVVMGDGRYLAVWECTFDFYCDECPRMVQYSVYDGEGWSEAANITESLTGHGIPTLFEDVRGRPILVTGGLDGNYYISIFDGDSFSEPEIIPAPNDVAGYNMFEKDGYLTLGYMVIPSDGSPVVSPMQLFNGVTFSNLTTITDVVVS